MAATNDNTHYPRHGRHAAAGQPANQPTHREEVRDAALDPARRSASIAAAVPVVSPADVDQELQMGDAPNPIGVDPEETGSFSRLRANEGARLTTRANASETASWRAQNARPVEAVRMSTSGRPKVERHETGVKTNGRVFAILGIAAVLVVAILGWLLTRALLSVDSVPQKPAVEQTQVAVGESIDYRDVTYTLAQQKSGSYVLTSTSGEQSGSTVLAEITGEPVALILYNSVFVIPENLPDGTWDLIARPLGDGSLTQQVTNGEGQPIVGEGQIAEATLQGSAIQIVTAAGESTSVALE